MRVQTFLKGTAIAVLIAMTTGCEQEPLQLQDDGKSDCPGCQTLDDTIGQPPDISFFSPKGGVVGSMVTVHGNRFSATPSNNIVKINGTVATVISATTTTLVVSVPCGATTGKIRVSVSGLYDESSSDFTVQPHLINSFNPKKGIAGTRVTINGSGFCAMPSANVVTFDGIPAMVISATATALVAPVPAGATTGKVSVTSGGVQIITVMDFQILDIPLNGLVAFYPFDGNANDISPNQLNGTVTGAVLSPDRSGNASSSYLFDGYPDNINMGNPSALQISNSITVGVWVKLSDNNLGSENILSKMDMPDQPTQGYYLMTVPRGVGGTIGTSLNVVRTSPPTCQNFLSGILQPSTWVFLTIVINGTNIHYYFDGVPSYTSSSQCPLVSGNLGNFLIGRGWGAISSFEGNIDDVAVYNRALSDEEVVKLYQQNILQ